MYRYILFLPLLLLLAACTGIPDVKGLAPVTGASGPTANSTKSAEPLYRAMTRKDRRIADRAVRRALETALSGTTFRWRNPDSGHFGTVTPLATYKTTGGFFCRTYRENLTIAGRSEQYRDRACRDKKGIWRTVREIPGKAS